LIWFFFSLKKAQYQTDGTGDMQTAKTGAAGETKQEGFLQERYDFCSWDYGKETLPLCACCSQQDMLV